MTERNRAKRLRKKLAGHLSRPEKRRRGADKSHTGWRWSRIGRLRYHDESVKLTPEIIAKLKEQFSQGEK